MNGRPSAVATTRPGARGVSEVLGSILIFGLVLAVLALVQASAVPAANEQVEFEHSQRVAGDLQVLDQNIDAAGTRGSLGSTAIEAGVRYPNRILFVNPGPAGGSLTTDATPVALNGFAGDSDDGASDYDLSAQSFSTAHLNYRVGYQEYADAPELYYDNGVLFQRYDEGGSARDVVVDGGSLVSGRRITVVMLEGEFSTQVQGELSVNVVPVTAAIHPVTVDGSGAELVLRTRLSETEWAGILGPQFDTNAVSGTPKRCSDIDLAGSSPTPDDGRYLIGCTYTAPTGGDEFGDLVLQFEDERYDLRLAKVGLTTNNDVDPTASFTEEGPEYLVSVGTADPDVIAGQSVDLTVEVRDRFNNPVSGVAVEFDEAGTTGVDDTRDSAADGRATYTVTTPGGSASTVTVEAMVGDGATERLVTFTVTATKPATSGSSGTSGLESINPRSSDVYFAGGQLLSPSGTGGNKQQVYEATFRNTGSQVWTFKQARVSFVLSEEVVSQADPVVWRDENGNVVDADIGTVPVAGDFVDITDVPIPAAAGGTDGEVTLAFTFDGKIGAGGAKQNFMILTVEQEDANSNRVFQTYFISDTTP